MTSLIVRNHVEINIMITVLLTMLALLELVIMVVMGMQVINVASCIDSYDKDDGYNNVDDNDN